MFSEELKYPVINEEEGDLRVFYLKYNVMVMISKQMNTRRTKKIFY